MQPHIINWALTVLGMNTFPYGWVLGGRQSYSWLHGSITGLCFKLGGELPPHLHLSPQIFIPYWIVMQQPRRVQKGGSLRKKILGILPFPSLISFYMRRSLPDTFVLSRPQWTRIQGFWRANKSMQNQPSVGSLSVAWCFNATCARSPVFDVIHTGSFHSNTWAFFWTELTSWLSWPFCLCSCCPGYLAALPDHPTVWLCTTSVLVFYCCSNRLPHT